MTQNELVAFFEIIRSGTLSAAAENLYITQPALTRRIQSLERELGYSLFIRKKGQKRILLTEKGNAFVPVAHRMQDTWQDALAIRQPERSDVLSLASIGSVSSYILPEVFRSLAQQEASVRIRFHNYHSAEAYGYVARGAVDLAIISDDMYYKDIETIPLFQEPCVLLANTSRAYPSLVSPSDLDPQKEILLPWYPEFQAWHDYWFGSETVCRSFVDQMSLLEYFLSRKDTWAVAPVSVALKASQPDYVSVHQLKSAPPERIIYYLKRSNASVRYERPLLDILSSELKKLPVKILI